MQRELNVFASWGTKYRGMALADKLMVMHSGLFPRSTAGLISGYYSTLFLVKRTFQVQRCALQLRCGGQCYKLVLLLLSCTGT